MSTSASLTALRLYRRALRLCQAQPSAGLRSTTSQELRSLARNSDTARLQSRISALRAILPRRLWPSPELGQATADLHSIEVSRGARRRSSRSMSKVRGVHADDLSRHNALIERMNFRGPVWRR